MNYWIVKGRPSENDFEIWLQPNRLDKWRTASPPSTWASGDRLFFWKAAPDTCVVGLGEIAKVGAREPRGSVTNFWVRYQTPFLPRPVGIQKLRGDPTLRSASFLKSGPAGTLFPLTAEQGKRLFALLQRPNPQVADAWPDLSGEVPALTDVDLLEVGYEGMRRLVQHMRVERDRRLVESKKREALEQGRLLCEACGFDFAETYGAIGAGFCEVHHRKPLSNSGAIRTPLRELAIVCSNCHRMLHRGGGRSISALKRMLRTTRGLTRHAAVSASDRGRAAADA